MTRLLAIDLGARRIGLAVGDTATGSILGLATIRRADAEREARTLGRIADEQAVDEIVVGLPLNMDGSEGEQAEATRAWADTVLPALGRPVCWRDERLSSERAERRLGRPPRGRSGGPPSPVARAARRAAVDREAAASIAAAEMDARAGLVEER